MKKDQINIIGCKIGRSISMDYFCIQDALNYSVSDDQVPHPDLRKAVEKFRPELAQSFYVSFIKTKDDTKRFTPNGFSISETEGDFFINISGKILTPEEEVVNIKSGKIPLKNAGLEDKLKNLRDELFYYFFEEKTAQEKIPFQKK